MNSALVSPAVYLEWDSQFFQKRIGRVTTTNMLDQNADEVDAWANDNLIDCVYYLADGLESKSVRAAEVHNYHLMDLRVTYAIDLAKNKLDLSSELNIRMALKEDLVEIKRMAGGFHGISRFFADDHFSRKKCTELYETWIERDFNDTDRNLWVSEDQGIITGYTSASIIPNNNVAEIGLVGVNPNYRGQGIGYQLQLAVLNQIRQLGSNQVEVVTQGRNISAQNLYQKCGYHLKSIDLWYHKWFINNEN